MKNAAYFVALSLVVAVGCASEPEKKPAGKKAFLELKMQSPKTRTITVDLDGNIADVISESRSVGKLKADDLKTLQDMAAKLDLSKIPIEGYKTPDGKPVDGGRIYDLTYFVPNPPRLVHSMDGAPEDPGFTKLRDTLEVDANKIGR